MSKGKVVLGTLAGLAIGVLSGILFAPKKGSKTRKKLMGKGDDYLHKLKFESTKKDAEYLAAKAKAKYVDAQKDLENTASELNHSVS